MRGEEDALPHVLEFDEKVGDDLCREHVEPVRGLVEDDDLGIVHDGDDERDLLQHTRREIAHLDFGEAVDAEAGEELLFAGGERRLVHAVHGAEEVKEIARGKEALEL